MAEGPGTYDDAATVVRVATSAQAVVVIVFRGDRGSGFSIQMEQGLALPDLKLPALLRSIATEIEKDMN
jgi:hypothetical protein